MATSRRLRLGALVTGALIVLSMASSASAKANRYSGTCQIPGAATGYDPPLSFRPAARAFHFQGSGQCTGSMDGRQPMPTSRVHPRQNHR